VIPTGLQTADFTEAKLASRASPQGTPTATPHFTQAPKNSNPVSVGISVRTNFLEISVLRRKLPKRHGQASNLPTHAQRRIPLPGFPVTVKGTAEFRDLATTRIRPQICSQQTVVRTRRRPLNWGGPKAHEQSYVQTGIATRRLRLERASLSA
jgi:hypothetical protein